MREKKENQTRQKQLILAMLQAKQNEHVNAEQILSYLREIGESVGLTHRVSQPDKLVQDGVIIKYVGLDGITPATSTSVKRQRHRDQFIWSACSAGNWCT